MVRLFLSMPRTKKYFLIVLYMCEWMPPHILRTPAYFCTVGFKNSRLRQVGSRQSIQYPEIKKRCGDTATVLYCLSWRSNKGLQIENENVPRGTSEQAAAFLNDRASKLRFI